MLERFKRTGKDSTPSGAVATSERPRDEETRVADATDEWGDTRERAGAADSDDMADTRAMRDSGGRTTGDDATDATRPIAQAPAAGTGGAAGTGTAASTDATRPIGQTGAGNGDAFRDTDADDGLASEREARRRERENRRAQRRDGAAARTGGAGATGAAAAGAAGAASGGTAVGATHGDETAPTTATEDGEDTRTLSRGALTRDALKTARARQRDEFGGLNWGASFFGWLVAVGVAAIMLGLLSAAGAAIGLTTQDANVDSLGLGGGIALLAALMLAYFCGGYVGGRMSRFDGARQGAGVWIIALVVTVALALLAVVAGDKYNVLAQLGLPSIPVGESEFRSGGWIALLAVLVGTFLAAVAGGKWGERYHARVDRAGFVD